MPSDLSRRVAAALANPSLQQALGRAVSTYLGKRKQAFACLDFPALRAEVRRGQVGLLGIDGTFGQLHGRPKIPCPTGAGLGGSLAQPRSLPGGQGPPSSALPLRAGLSCVAFSKGKGVRG